MTAEAEIQNLECVWPDPKILEETIRTESPNNKKPSLIVMNEQTWREILMGPASGLWQGMVAQVQLEAGKKNTLMSVQVKVVGSVPSNTMLLQWATDELKPRTGTYSWPEPTRDAIAELSEQMAQTLLKAMEDERVATMVLAGADANRLNENKAERIWEWGEAQRMQAIAKQRLFVMSRLEEQWRRAAVADEQASDTG